MVLRTLCREFWLNRTVPRVCIFHRHPRGSEAGILEYVQREMGTAIVFWTLCWGCWLHRTVPEVCILHRHPWESDAGILEEVQREMEIPIVNCQVHRDRRQGHIVVSVQLLQKAEVAGRLW